MTTNTIAAAQIAEQVAQIARQFIGKKGVSQKTVAALEAAGFQISGTQQRWNFGTSGTVKVENNEVLLQFGCAEARRARNGYSVNACWVSLIALA